MRVYKDSDPTLTILGRFWTGAGLRGGVSFHCPTSRQLAFSIRWGGTRGGSPGPGCLPHGAGRFEAGIVHVVRFFRGIGGRACVLGKTTPRERRLLTSQLLFHSSHRATHLWEERQGHSPRTFPEIKNLPGLPGRERQRERERERERNAPQAQRYRYLYFCWLRPWV